MNTPPPEATNPESPLIATGIPGLDDILLGGLPAGQTYLIEGDPGTGKTTLAMQFMQAGLQNGEPCLYVTFSESRRDLLSSSHAHGWSLEPQILEIIPSHDDTLDESERYTVFHPSEVEIVSTLRRLTGEVDRVNPTRLVLDSLAEFKLLSGDAVRYRRQLLALRQFLAARDMTVFLLDDRTANENGIGDLQTHSVAHGVIRLEKLQRSYGVTRRHLEIVKVRGTGYREGFHDYTIERGGMKVYPRLLVRDADDSAGVEPGPIVRSDLAELDRMTGDGIDSGSSTLILGPTGSGKSSLALRYAFAASQRGERALYYAFDEMAATIKKRARNFGMDLDAEIRKKTLRLQQVDPAELSPGEFAYRIQREVEQNGARLVVIDSLNGYLNAMPGENDLLLQMHELLAFLNQKDVATFVVLTQQGLVGALQVPVDISYLADNLIVLRYFEAGGSVRQAISAVKKRGGDHERTIREYKFASSGICIGEPLTKLRGILTGLPEQIGNEAPLKETGHEGK
jgi:circadian clock protein KaiC